MHAKTGRNILVALLLSLFLTLVLGAFYTFYPVISLILTSLWNRIVSSQQDINGIVAVGGGVSQSFVKMLAIVAPILFLIIFALLQKRAMKN